MGKLPSIPSAGSKNTYDIIITGGGPVIKTDRPVFLPQKATMFDLDKTIYFAVRQFLLKRYGLATGHYEIIKEKTGVIPMTNQPFARQES